MRNCKLLLLLCSAFLVACNNPQTLEQCKSKYAVMDSINIHYKTSGEGDNAIVFIHGFGCDINSWQQQFAYFSDKAKLLFIDLPGYGKSDKPHTEYTLDFFADAVNAVMDAEHINNAMLIGHSLGTPVCRQMVLKYPERVTKMVDIDGVYCFYPADSTMAAAYHAFAGTFNTDSLKPVIAGFVESLCIPQTPSAVKKYALSTMPKTPKYIAYSTMKNLIDERYWTNEKITIPTLVIVSKNSEIPPDYEQIMSNLYSNMSYCEMDSVGHFIMMEKPQMLSELIEKFSTK